MAKLQIFLSVLLIAYGVQADPAVRNPRSIASRSLALKVKHAVAAATTAIALVNSTVSSLESCVKEAHAEAKAAVEAIETEAESIRSSVTEEVSTIQSSISEDIADIESAGGTCDVSSCTSPLTALQTTAETIVSEANSCVDAVETKANAYLETIDSSIDSAVCSLNDYITEINECVANVTTVIQANVATLCVQAVQVKITADAATVPVKLLAEIVEIKAEIVALKTNLATCSCTDDITTLSTSESTACEEAEACVAKIVSSGCCT